MTIRLVLFVLSVSCLLSKSVADGYGNAQLDKGAPQQSSEGKIPEIFKFDQDLNAVAITTENSLADGQEAILAVRFWAPITSAPDLDFSAAKYRSGGELQITLSQSPGYSITNCMEGHFEIPNITNDEKSLNLRIVKRYPWILVKCNGKVIIKHNFFSFKNQECRSVWAIKANMVTLTKTDEIGRKEALKEIDISKQEAGEESLRDCVYEKWYPVFFPDFDINFDQIIKSDQWEIFDIEVKPAILSNRYCETVHEKQFMRFKCFEKDGTITFRCPHSNVYYSYQVNSSGTYYTLSCPEDKRFYQACGQTTKNTVVDVKSQDESLCGIFVCDLTERNISIRSDSAIMVSKICNGKNDCTNTDLDEKNCDFRCETGNSREQYISASRKCDNACDCRNCADEASCGLYTKGTFCGDGKYIETGKICNLHDDCPDWRDEKNCIKARCIMTLYHNGITRGQYVSSLITPESQLVRLEMDDNCDGVPRCDDSSDEVCVTRTCQRTFKKSSPVTRSITITLNNANICTVPMSDDLYRICDDVSDQINCTDSADVALQCKIGGELSTVSKYVVCKDVPLCDDDINNDCMQITEKCLIHKHQFCDGVNDCEGGTDEREELCQVTKSVLCVRRYPAKSTVKLPIPKLWIRDGVADCEDEVDETPSRWKLCGNKNTLWATSFTEADTICEQFYLCANETKKFVSFPFLCDKVNSCGRENEVCAAAKNHIVSFDKQNNRKNYQKRSHFCFPGLENLQYLYRNCTERQFIHPEKPFGVTSQQTILVPEDKFDCSYLFGASYVFSTCTRSCTNEAIPCPLNKLESDSCKTVYSQKDRFFTFAKGQDNESYLTFLEAHSKQQHASIEDNSRVFYTPNLFACPNKRCIPFSKVCNLADDCGDSADEKNCFNHFKCSNSREFIPLSSVCDGILDCPDASDECNERCGNNLKIIEEEYLTICSWTIGLMATFLNTIAVIATARHLHEEKSSIKLSNQAFILLIALGDLCVGIYLIAISGFDSKFKADNNGHTFCKHRFDEWFSSGTCAALGVLSTFGSELSLFAMTTLSVYRVCCVKSKFSRGTITRKVKGALVSLTFFLIAGSLLISFIPLINTAEDFFVNGLVYPNNPLLIGDIDKEKHIEILQAHYGHFYHKDFNWEAIRALIRSMFTTFNGPIVGKRIHFYGNSGVCLFKFFVTPDDPQRAYTWFIIVLNAVCFVVITVSYILLHTIVKQSSKRSITQAGKGKDSRKKSNERSKTQAGKRKGSDKNTTLNRKIALMIATDFLCWIPFIAVCTLHYTKLMDATPWYSLFSIVFIPLNSVINPLLYDTVGLVNCIVRLMPCYKRGANNTTTSKIEPVTTAN